MQARPHAELPVPYERLVKLLEAAGRPAVLAALKDAGVSSLPERQRLATLVSKTHREGVPSELPAAPSLPQPANHPLCVRAEAGLCNKLRTILSYAEVARSEGRHLIVLWVNGGPCPAVWEQLFEPLEGVTILNLDSPGAKRFEAALNVGMQLMLGAVPSEFGTHARVAGTEEEERMYLRLKPVPALERAITETVERCGGAGR